MPQVIEAILCNGIRKPIGDLPLKESQRVRLIVETLDASGDRAAALDRLIAGIQGMRFFSQGRLSSKDELHDRV
jgi:predicted DNA-binding antitoxin AbrB/MazE fold protein